MKTRYLAGLLLGAGSGEERVTAGCDLVWSTRAVVNAMHEAKAR
jgi:hypothetical protein